MVAQLEQAATAIGGWMSSLATKGQQHHECKEQHSSLFRIVQTRLGTMETDDDLVNNDT
jgi:hypothetical protein